MAIVKLDRDNNPGKARWCDEHRRLECTKNRTKGRGQCHMAATRGTNGCKLHVGVSNEVAKAQGQSRITVSAWNPHGDSKDAISAPMAVLGVLQMSWLRLASYSELLRRQIAAEADLNGSPREDEDPETSGLIGFRYGAAGKEGTVYVQSEEIRALVMLEATERDRVVKYAETAHKMGISDKMINLAERWGDIVAGQIALMLDALHLSPEQALQVPRLLHTYLGSMDMGALTAEAEKR